MCALRVRLFGQFTVSSETHGPEGPRGQKAQELFAYVLLNRERKHPRETLAAMLWGDCPTAQSKKYLRQALWQLQTSLGSQNGAPRPLSIEPDWVQLNPKAEVWLDVTVFEQAFAAGNGVAAAEMEPAQAQALEDAVQLYRGDLLEGWYQDWCLFERERLQNLYLAALDRLMGYCETRGAYEQGLAYGSRILRLDRARECTHQRLIRMHFLAGDRAGGLRQYERCATALREELGVDPSERTTALRDQLRAGRLECADAAVPMPVPSGGVAAQLTEALGRLRQLGSVLTSMESQVQREIRVVERALKRHTPLDPR